MKNKWLRRIINFFKVWNELLLGLLMILGWIPFTVLIRILDPTAAVLDLGVLSQLYLSLLAFGVIHAFVWIGIKLNLPVIFDYYQNKAFDEFKLLTLWQKALLSFLFVALYLIATILVVRVW